MFRQMVAFRWAEGTSPASKQGLRDALERLREIPELVAMTWGDDAGHFDGNFDFVVVMDFADFASARRYVDHPLHRRYVEGHATKVVGERVVVQHDWVPERRSVTGSHTHHVAAGKYHSSTQASITQVHLSPMD